MTVGNISYWVAMVHFDDDKSAPPDVFRVTEYNGQKFYKYEVKYHKRENS